MLGGSNQVDMSQNKIKVVIIIVLKLHLGVNPRQSLGHGSGRSAWVEPSQYKDKSYYYCSFKTRLKGQPRQCPSHKLGGST